VQRHRREILDLSALVLSLAAIRVAVCEVPAAAAVCALVVASLVPLLPQKGPSTKVREFMAALPRRVAAVLATGALLRYFLARPLDALWFGAAWPAFAWFLALDWLRILRLALRALGAARSAAVWALRAARGLSDACLARFRWLGSPLFKECCRCAALLGAALWLLRGFARPTLHGTGDAYWYGLNLADMVAQVRAGVFPVWVGQSIYQFNGAMCPIRIAPLYSYLGALVDALTLHGLGTFALQNLVVASIGVCGMFTAYLGLRALLPGSRWTAAALAALFLSCPATLGLAYNTDLYMSWTTVPVVPLVWYATVRSYRDRGAMGALVLLGAALGLCWWGHSPIALWSTLLAGMLQVVRLVVQGEAGLHWRPLLASALVFGAIAAYPVGSVLLYPAEPGGHSAQFQLATSRVIASFVRDAFPAAYLPLSPNGRSPTDFQLGYSLWAILALLVLLQRRVRDWIARAPLAGAALLSLLVLPIPGLNPLLWAAMPAIIRDTTGNWALSRLCMILAAATTFSAAAWLAGNGLASARSRRIAMAFICVCCAWSFWEAGKFVAGSRTSAPPSDSAVDLLRPESIQLTRYSYSMFPTFPASFTHGVADPVLENRLLDARLAEPLATNAAAALAQGRQEALGRFHWGNGSEASYAVLDRKLQMVPGRYYLLEVGFAGEGPVNGILQVQGAHLTRDYLLPDYGEPRSFGAGGAHSNTISIYTTAGPQELVIRFLPANPPGRTGPVPPVAWVRQLSYDRDTLPVRPESWIPYRARVHSPGPAWLETPREFQTGYTAWVDGKPAEVRESKDAQVCVAVPAGESRVTLAYVPPAGLRALFWMSFSAIAAVAGFASWRVILHLLGIPSPAKASRSTP